MSPRPLTGVRVLDLTRLLPGPFLSQLLLDLGADVVKVEEPGVGDFARWLPPEADGAGHAFAAVNRGKRSIAVDLKSAAGREVALRLAGRSDVLIDSFRPGVMERLGFGDDVLAAASPRLVRCSLVGYGPGPLRDDVGHDLNYEAIAGILATQGTPDRPVESGVPVADLAGAMYAATGILAALLERERTGRGGRVEVALTEAALAFNLLALHRASASDDVPARGAWELGGGLPGYRVYRARDGGFVALGALEERFWLRFTSAVSRRDLDLRHLDPSAVPEVEAVFAADARDAWVDRLRKAGVPATPVLSPHEAIAHPQNLRIGGLVSPGSPLTGLPAARKAPALGEHTEAVLLEAGYSREEIARLRSVGAIA